MITLTVSTTVLELNNDLLWADEFDWAPVEQVVERSLTGALIVDVRARVYGRPITLRPADNGAAWQTRAVVQQLYAWAAVPALVMTLSLRGQSFNVVWRHHDSPALEAAPVVDYSDLDPNDWYRTVIKLMVVQ